MAIPKEKSLWRWLNNEKVLIIVLGVLIGDAVSRILMRFTEHIASPLLRSLLHEDPNNATYVQIGNAQLQVRAFAVALFEFGLVILIAYLVARAA